MDFSLNKNSIHPALDVQLNDAVGVLDLTATSGDFIYRAMTTGANTITGATVTVSEVSGVERKVWTAGDVSNVGLYQGWFKITYLADNSNIVYPGDRPFVFEITDFD